MSARAHQRRGKTGITTVTSTDEHPYIRTSLHPKIDVTLICWTRRWPAQLLKAISSYSVSPFTSSGRRPASSAATCACCSATPTGDLSDRQRKMIDEAEKSCARLVALIAELSDIAKLDSGVIALARQPIDLFALVAEVAELVHEARDREVRLEVRGEDGAAHVNGDATRLRAAFDAIFRAILREKAGPCDGGRRASARNPERDGRRRCRRREAASVQAAYDARRGAVRRKARRPGPCAAARPPRHRRTRRPDRGRRHRFQDPRQDQPPIFWRRIPFARGSAIISLPLTE